MDGFESSSRGRGASSPRASRSGRGSRSAPSRPRPRPRPPRRRRGRVGASPSGVSTSVPMTDSSGAMRGAVGFAGWPIAGAGVGEGEGEAVGAGGAALVAPGGVALTVDAATMGGTLGAGRRSRSRSRSRSCRGSRSGRGSRSARGSWRCGPEPLPFVAAAGGAGGAGGVADSWLEALAETASTSAGRGATIEPSPRAAAPRSSTM